MRQSFLPFSTSLLPVRLVQKELADGVDGLARMMESFLPNLLSDGQTYV